jgi:hypothetical protein
MQDPGQSIVHIAFLPYEAEIRKQVIQIVYETAVSDEGGDKKKAAPKKKKKKAAKKKPATRAPSDNDPTA